MTSDRVDSLTFSEDRFARSQDIKSKTKWLLLPTLKFGVSRNHIEELRKSTGTTMFITTHYMEEADEFCDRIAFIHQGRIELVGTAAELKATLGAQATLDDVFKKFTGAEIESGGNYRDVRRTRRSVREHV